MIRAINLTCEFLTEPIGIDIQTPRLAWNVEGALMQSAYRVTAKRDGIEIYDSGRIESNKMTHIYPLLLTSRERVEWSVTLWDEDGNIGKTSESFFEMGLLTKEDFCAYWIRGDYKVKKKYRYPTDHFKKTFNVSDVKKARLYASACGIYEARINGSRVGEFVLAPGHTDYRKRIQYQTYDVTDILTDGENCITVELADGW